MMRRIAVSAALCLLSLSAQAEVKILGVKNPPGDGTAPDAISDLTASLPTANSCFLSWTAPGDDGASGTAASYDCRRRAGSTFVEANWTGATSAGTPPTPSVAGSTESFTSSGLLSSTQYAFACKTSDEVPNISPISSPAATCTTSAPTFCSTMSSTFCDEFETDDLATNWDQRLGTWTMDAGNNNLLTSPSTGWTQSHCVSNGNPYFCCGQSSPNECRGLGLTAKTAATTGNGMWAAVQLPTIGSDEGLILRATGVDGDRADNIYYNAGVIWWGDIFSDGQYGLDHASCTQSMSNGDYLVAQISGTSAATARDVKVWVVSSASPPTGLPGGTPTCEFYNSGTCTGNNCCRKNGVAGTSCTCVTTNCGGGVPTTGNRAGIWVFQSANTFNNFALGN